MTPPPNELAALLDDLIIFANRDDVEPITQAAVCHAQFEIIHPFGDGNGRVGRMLIAWLLIRRLALMVPPPVSVAIAADVAGYASGLALCTVSATIGDGSAGSPMRWRVAAGPAEPRRQRRADQAAVARSLLAMSGANAPKRRRVVRNPRSPSSTLGPDVTDTRRRTRISRKASLATLHRLV